MNMSNMNAIHYERPYAAMLASRLSEPRRFIQVIAGARQVGKTTLVMQVVKKLGAPSVYVSADGLTLSDIPWLTAQWERARLRASDAQSKSVILVLDEVQKISGWSETVKRLWDEDTRLEIPVKVVLLGSAPLLMQQGLTESMAGRFEVLHLPHWSYTEMREAFGFSLDDYIIFGGYPGAASLIRDPLRWRRYIQDSLIETTISRDVLLMQRVDKPALLRRLFELGCRYSGQILSYTKMLGQLQDAGNTVTLAHYLDLLSRAGMLTGLQKYAEQEVHQRASSPKLQVLNTALMTASMDLSPDELREDRELWGRLVESAIGAHLANGAFEHGFSLYYWRENNREVDFILKSGKSLVAIEVKSGRMPDRFSGLKMFAEFFRPSRIIIVGENGIPFDDFLEKSVSYWLRQ